MIAILFLLLPITVFCWDTLGDSTLWLYGCGVSIGLLWGSGQAILLFVAIGCFVMFGHRLVVIKEKNGAPEDCIAKTQAQNRREKRIEKEYGIIDYSDK